MAEGWNRSAAPATYHVDASEIDAFLKALRQHTDKNRLGRQMRKGLAEATEPFQKELHDLIPRALPSSGGLGALIQSETRFSVVARQGRWAGIWVRATAKASAKKKSRDLSSMLGRGQIRHPVFLSAQREYRARPPWVWQTAGTNPALLRGAVKDAEPDLRVAALEVMESIARQIMKETT